MPRAAVQKEGASMPPLRRSTRRDFLKTSALGLAGLAAAPGVFGAKDLKLKKPIKVGCQTILSGPLGGYGEVMGKGRAHPTGEINPPGGVGRSPLPPNLPRHAGQSDARGDESP